MKLMSDFKQQLDSLGEIKRVWMTSFNINIDFIETHVLPAVLGMEPPRNRMDYETLQLALNDKKIDFRIFCDKRVLRVDQNKRTAITVHPVSISELKKFPGRYRDKSLFHPKVIYLEDHAGNMILGAGSANLTVSGWGRNQEVFDFREVSNNDQYKQIKKFFAAIDPELELGIRRAFYGKDLNWQFVHSFGTYNFLDYLADYGDIKSLTVWSPYLAEDLPAFIKKLTEYFELPNLTVSLVPDRIECRYIRTPWRKEIGVMLETGKLTFHANPSHRHDNSELTHAKVWLAMGTEGTVMAIGSWNFTGPGCSSLVDDNGSDQAWSNVEAGILHECANKPKICGKLFKPTEDDFASSTMLNDDDLKVPELLPFDLMVIFDWQKSEYQVEGQWHDGEIYSDYKLKLPGICSSLALAWRPRKKLESISQTIDESEKLLTDHFYVIERNGEMVFQGLIVEIGSQFRRAQSFSSLQDLLNSYVSEADDTGDGNAVLREILKKGGSSEDEVAAAIIDADKLSISYFRLFYAMQEYSKRLDGITCDEELQKWLFTYPGCLQELAEKVSNHIAQSDSKAFSWFLANEVNCLHNKALVRYEKLRQPYAPKIPPKHIWKNLVIKVPKLPDGDGRRENYVLAIEKECSYAKH